jgi:hypothetical protein
MKMIEILRKRFEENMDRHPDLNWDDVTTRLQGDANSLETLKRIRFDLMNTG